MNKLNFENQTIKKGATGIFLKQHFCPEVSKREIKMGEIEENWQPAKFYCSGIKLIYSIELFIIPIICQYTRGTNWAMFIQNCCKI